MNESIREGKSIEIALKAALEDLKSSENDVEIEILQQPVKGIFGMTKMAKVRVTRKHPGESVAKEESASREETESRPPVIRKVDFSPADLQQGKEMLEKTLRLMGVDGAEVKAYPEEDTIILDVQSDAEGLLIGRHGQTLSSLQYLINRMQKAGEGEGVRYIVDIGGYRNRHRQILEKMATRIAKRVAETKTEEQLEAMNAFDRRIVHMAVKDNPEVTTYSLGEGSFRRVVIAPAKPTNS